MISPGQQLDWPDFMRFVDALDATFAESDTPFLVKLLRGLYWTGLADEATFDKVRGALVAEVGVDLREGTHARLLT